MNLVVVCGRIEAKLRAVAHRDKVSFQDYGRVPLRAVIAVQVTKAWAEAVDGGEPTEEGLRKLWAVLEETVA